MNRGNYLEPLDLLAKQHYIQDHLQSTSDFKGSLSNI